MRHTVSSRVEAKRRQVHARMVGTAILVALSAAACIFDQGNPDKSAGRRDSDDNQGGAQEQSSGTSGTSGVIPTPTTTNTPDTSTPDTAQPVEAGNDANADTG